MYIIALTYLIPLFSTILFTYIFEANTNLLLGFSILLAFLIGLLLYVLFICLLFFGYMPIAAKINPVNKFNVLYIHTYAVYALFFLRIKLKVHGYENLEGFDLKKEKYILTPNHKSLADVIIMYKVFPGIGYVAKKEVYDMPLIPPYFKALGVVPIDRNNDKATAKAMISAIKKVKNYEPMCIFTEGGIKTRETDKMVDVRPGAYKLAVKSEAAIIPISIKNNHLISKNFPLKRTKVDLYIHKPIRYEEYKDLNTIEIGEMVFNKVNSAL